MIEGARAELLTIRDLLRFAVSRFNEAHLFFGHGCDNAYDEAAFLILHTLHLPLDRLEPFLDARVLEAERNTLLNLIERRVRQRVPTAYLTREAWLAGHPFYVDERVIIPRSFIAELLESGLAPWIDDPLQVRRALDLCTGSGCLAVLAALAFPEARVDGVDLSDAAMEVARRNVATYRLDDRVELVHSNLFGALAGRSYDLIISNPPYVNAASMRSLPEEFQAEPALALAGGEDGLDLVRIILREARAHLNPGGILVAEIGHNRAALESCFPDLPFTWIETAAGNEFVFMLQREELPA